MSVRTSYSAVRRLLSARASLREPERSVVFYEPRLAAAPDEPREYRFLANAYVLVKMRAPELNYPQGDQNVYTTYAGTGGVSIGSLWRRIMFALRFAEIKILLSDDFTPGVWAE